MAYPGGLGFLGAPMTKRLSAERLAIARDWSTSLPQNVSKELLQEVLAELDAVTRERNEALEKIRQSDLINLAAKDVGLAGMNFITDRERGSK